MTFPVVQTTNTSVEESDVTSHTVNLPASIVSGDLLIVACAFNDTPATVTFPAGWTKFAEDNGGSVVKSAVAWRDADGTEGATITVTTDTAQGSAHVSYRISGGAVGSAKAPEVSAVLSGVNLNPNSGNIVPADGALDYLWLCVYIWDTDANTTNTAVPAGFGSNITVNGTTADDAGAGVSQRSANLASLDPGAGNISASQQWIAYTVAISPFFVVVPDLNINYSPDGAYVKVV